MVVVQKSSFGVNFTDEEINQMNGTIELLTDFLSHLHEIEYYDYDDTINSIKTQLQQLKYLDDDSIEPEPDPEEE